MKKQAIALVLVLLISALLLTTALAVGDGGEVEEITVTFTAAEAGEDYMLFLLPGDAELDQLLNGEILFMDQVTADASGQVRALYVAPEFDSCRIALSGSFPDGGASPRWIGSWEHRPAQSLVLPAATVTVEEEAFAGGQFTHVYLSGKVKSIGKRAFADCASLSYIEIPASVTAIASDAFENSPNVTIGCQADSAAYRFAVAHSISYRLLDA